MTQFKVIGAAALLASALATPAMAQQVINGPARCSSVDAYGNCETMRPGYGPDARYHRRAYRQDPNWQDQTWQDQSWQDQTWQDQTWQDSYNRYDPGPADVAADVVGGVVGGAVGTATAIATAPFGGPDYAPGGYYARGSADYARLNGFVCTPGTWLRGDDGLQHPCQ
ncbi:hypothetical protein [Bradyrhizobium genosp. P]|uniref:hypothetical protein n=1 Tax=Bradyrhizobium genosp. P TaxID=83641 RepID=UPI003CFB8FBD